MKTKIQIKSIIGELLFEFEKDGNTVRDTVEQAVLSVADLSGANLYGANLYGADLYGADLSRTNLRGANLRGANLYVANLRGADLCGADLYGANLYGANLYGANLYGANLYGANLRGADLYGADFDENSLSFQQTRILPEGDIIGYKKCKNNIIVKLLIPKEAKRTHAFGRKCRSEYAEVLEIYGADVAYSEHDNSFKYEKGKIVTPVLPFSENWQEECESGIHFFITKVEAENY